MIFLDLINLDKIRRAIVYYLAIIVAIWLQTMVFSRVAPLGAKPMFLPALGFSIGLWEGGVWGAMLGLVAGMSCDMAYAESTVTFLVLFSLLGFASGVLADFFINRRFVACMLLSAAALLLTAFCQIVPLWIFHATPLGALLPVAALQTLWSVPFVVPCYFLARRVSGRAGLGAAPRD